MNRRVTLAALLLMFALLAGCSAPPAQNDQNAAYDPGYETESYQTFSAPDAPAAFDATPAPAAPEGFSMDFEAGLTDESWRYAPIEGTEEYAAAQESPFKDVRTSPLSTFSADVDTASYGILRRFLRERQRPEPEAVRIEELVNYFDYHYPEPDGAHPFSVTAELGVCPWEPEHLLCMIGVQAARLENTEEIANNLVFLLDVSGSMNEANKLPLVQESMKLLLEQLGDNDRVSIVTYAGSDRIVADSIPGSEQDRLTRLIDTLSAGGSTAGANGLRSAYELAGRNYIRGGNNRVILCSDGDFNVGESSVEDLQALIKQEREKGVFLSVLGYGMGNFKDNRMSTLADNGNGNYAYIDTLQEAHKVLADEFGATMFTVAKDVKLQVEFNPLAVSGYRLIGYDTRRLENEDFANDQKDAGDMGSGHTVTAFYELIPAGSPESAPEDPLKYSAAVPTGSDELMTVSLRYKTPTGDESRLTELPVPPEAYRAHNSENFLFASAVAEFGLLLTRSDYAAGSSAESALSRAELGLGEDRYGLRTEFTELVRAFMNLPG
jgi:Ca-activated chloride channel family protein